MHERKYTLADQNAFAELSGDNNPLHLDPVIARRYIFGQPVVHGVHNLLWALENWLSDHSGPVSLRSIHASFQKPTGLEETVRWEKVFDQDRQVRLELGSGGSVTTRIKLEYGTDEHAHFDGVARRFPEQRTPRNLTSGEMKFQSGDLDLCLNSEASAKLFPNLTQCISSSQIATLLATTRLVGVECPGYNSVFSELALSADASQNGLTLHYEVTNFDERIGLVVMKISAPGMTGTIKALVRPSPKRQAAYQDLKGLIASNEFTGQRALVIGGSRGLGEVVAKLLCAGGAQVKLTYNLGREDADRVIEEILSNGGDASSCHFNVLNPDSGLFDASKDDWVPTDLYYFATPFIAPSGKNGFSTDLFTTFSNFYVTGFAKTVERLKESGLRNVFYPSTVFIDELPANMAEYAAAKMAGETTCAFFEKNYKQLRVCKPRLPRMATDQTVSLIAMRNLDPVPVMLSALRVFRDSQNPPQ